MWRFDPREPFAVAGETYQLQGNTLVCLLKSPSGRTEGFVVVMDYRDLTELHPLDIFDVAVSHRRSMLRAAGLQFIPAFRTTLGEGGEQR